MAMTDAEAAASLRATNEKLQKIGGETDALLQRITDLQKALEVAIDSGGTVTQELEDAVKAVADQAAVVDEKVDDVVTNPVPEPKS